MTELKLQILLHLGDITELKADMVVSSIHRSKRLSMGRLSGHIGRRAGDTVQTELNKRQGELQFKQIVSCFPGKLTNFKQITFVCLYTWQDGNEEALENTVADCLDEASKMGYETIAIPALGMGGLKYPPYVVSLAIMKAITVFVYNYPTTSLKTVYLALHDPNIDSIRTFVQCTMAFCKGMEAQIDMLRPEPDDGSTWFTIQGQDLTQLLRSKPERAQPASRISQAMAAVSDLADASMIYSSETCDFMIKPSFSLSQVSINTQLDIKIPGVLKKLIQKVTAEVKSHFST